MIRLHQYPPFGRLPSLSPYCIKVEAYLRMAGRPYEVRVQTNPLRAPRGRMPFIEMGGESVPDSRLILEQLERSGEGSLDRSLSVLERAKSQAFRSLVEQDLIQVILYSRWVDPMGWQVLSREFARLFPIGLRFLAIRVIRRSLLSEADGTGIADFAPEEVYAHGDAMVGALSDELGARSYFLGEELHTIDASVFAFLLTVLETPIPVPIRQSVRSRPNLVSYCERVGERLGFSSGRSTADSHPRVHAAGFGAS